MATRDGTTTVVQVAPSGEPNTDGVTEDGSQPATDSAELLALKEQLNTEQQARVADKQDAERRIGRLASENGRRQQESQAQIDRLSDKIADQGNWQSAVQLESMDPSERATYVAEQSRLDNQRLREELIQEKEEIRADKEKEVQRGEAYQRAIASGVPASYLDFTSVESIEVSTQRWKEEQRDEEVGDLRSKLANLQEEVTRTQSAARDHARSLSGDTAVPDASGAGTQSVLDNIDMPEEAAQLVRELEELEQKPKTYHNRSGMIMSKQLRLAEMGYDVRVS